MSSGVDAHTRSYVDGQRWGRLESSGGDVLVGHHSIVRHELKELEMVEWEIVG
jgi:hypothetical protein